MVEDSNYYYGIGLEHLEKGEVEEALVQFQFSLSLMPHFKTYERLYECYKRIGRNQEAFDCLEKAFEMNNRNDKVAVEYIRLLMERGQCSQAVSMLKKVLERNPTYGPAVRLSDSIKNVKPQVEDG
ncbi:MAG: tetratricopeptide repeat protein [Bacillota bacterium]